MATWKNCCIGIAIVSLLFLAIPIKIDGPGNKDSLESTFKEYIRKYNKTYNNNTAYEKRFDNFKKSMEEIEKLNQYSTSSEHSAKYGPTIFSDMSKDEFSEIHLSDEKPKWKDNRNIHKRHGHHDKHSNLQSGQNSVSDGSSKEDLKNRFRRAIEAGLPKMLDWRNRNFVNNIRNQGLCGACWAFSVVGVIETMVAIKTGKLPSLSVQEMIDCAKDGNYGCLGGDTCSLLSWLQSNSITIEPELLYPLETSATVCKMHTNNTVGIKVAGFSCMELVGNEGKILKMIANHGPVAVAVNALSWQHYLGGVIQFHCSGDRLDVNHAVELIGYDLTAEVPHYIVRNSWGTSFGDKGYMKLAIGSNICGLANEVSSVNVIIT